MTDPLHGCLEIDFFESQLHLLPERCVYWPAHSALLVADLHLGKEQTFRNAGLPVPDLLGSDLQRLTRALHRTGSSSLIILGDFCHALRGRSHAVHAQFSEWRKRHSELDCLLIRGNHDRHAGPPLPEWNVRSYDDPFPFHGMGLAHFPQSTASLPTLAGHLHPKYRLEFGPERLSLPCFLQRGRTLVLPAFSSFVDHGLIRREPSDGIYVIADDSVLQV
ncbi:ligase-associated DNA damage response endonuclease PdeM [Planctomicrobium sp. SH664]|uniref:ligase-associated DNA damage response endonuclease PdeM n=1 Tax=Planctomicrobium sp. SH664 TaxID=3448125 RepID=UPI003F5B9D8A